MEDFLQDKEKKIVILGQSIEEECILKDIFRKIG